MFDLATMKLFFAMLAIATNVVVLAYVVLLVAARFSAAAADRLDWFYELVAGQEMLYGALVSGTAMLGSLYLSEIANLPPCRLCWWQRYAMYPVAVVLAVAAWRNYPKVRLPVFVAVLVGQRRHQTQATDAGRHLQFNAFKASCNLLGIKFHTQKIIGAADTQCNCLSF